MVKVIKVYAFWSRVLRDVISLLFRSDTLPFCPMQISQSSFIYFLSSTTAEEAQIVFWSQNYTHLHMESSLREYVCEQITGYSDNVKKYFDSLAVVAETATNEETGYPQNIIQQMAQVDQNLQRAVEHSKVKKT